MRRDLRPYGYPDKAPHFCADEHEPIRHWDSENEQCPLCRASSYAKRMQEAISDVLDDIDGMEDTEDRPDGAGVRPNVFMRIQTRLQDFDQAGSAKAAGAPGAESTAAPTNTDDARTRHIRGDTDRCALCGWVRVHHSQARVACVIQDRNGVFAGYHPTDTFREPAAPSSFNATKEES